MKPPGLNINTKTKIKKNEVYKETLSGSIDFTRLSWKVGLNGITDSKGIFKGGEENQFKNEEIKINEIEELIHLGEGATSTVKLVIYEDQLLALKVVNMDDEKHEYSNSRVEIDTLKHIKSENVIRLLQAFVKGNRINLLLEYMDCGSLKDAYRTYRDQTNNNKKQTKETPTTPSEKLKFHKFPITILAYMARMTLMGLAQMLKCNIVHRDIKPSNLLLNSKGEVKLSDFGVAKELAKHETCIDIVGTMRYQAPERLLYQGYAIPSDIWSFGLTIYEIYMGYYPLREALNSEKEFKRAICGENPTALKGHIDIDEKKIDNPALRDFLKQCLTRNPHKRPTATQLLQHDFIQSNKSNTMHIDMKLFIKCYDLRNKVADEALEILKRKKQKEERNTYAPSRTSTLTQYQSRTSVGTPYDETSSETEDIFHESDTEEDDEQPYDDDYDD